MERIGLFLVIAMLAGCSATTMSQAVFNHTTQQWEQVTYSQYFKGQPQEIVPGAVDSTLHATLRKRESPVWFSFVVVPGGAIGTDDLHATVDAQLTLANHAAHDLALTLDRFAIWDDDLPGDKLTVIQHPKEAFKLPAGGQYTITFKDHVVSRYATELSLQAHCDTGAETITIEVAAPRQPLP